MVNLKNCDFIILVHMFFALHLISFSSALISNGIMAYLRVAKEPDLATWYYLYLFGLVLALVGSISAISVEIMNLG